MHSVYHLENKSIKGQNTSNWDNQPMYSQNSYAHNLESQSTYPQKIENNSYMPNNESSYAQNLENNSYIQNNEGNMAISNIPSGPIQSISTNIPNASTAGGKPKKPVTSRVKVVVRVRPPIQEDWQNSYNGEFQNCILLGDDRRRLKITKHAFDEREFNFDTVLGPESDQNQVYHSVAKDMISDVLQGYNATVLAYGQTGTGKTFTQFGSGTQWLPENTNLNSKELMGLIPRSVHHIFDHISQNNSTTEFRVTMSFMQIYMEHVMDLLDVEKKNLQIREDPKYGTFVDGLTTIVVNSPQDVTMLIQEGAKNRAVGSTNMNKVSSRSHVILNLTVEQKPFQDEDEKESDSIDRNNENSHVKRGTLTIVDLAGSERVSKSGSEGQSLEEAKIINKSLSALGNCVAALIDDNRSHVPFRDSKLTKLLTDSLGGNSKTCLIATVGPSLFNYDETWSTLIFATRAMAVKNHARINETVDFKTLSGTLQKKISMIEHEKYRLMARNVDLEREVEALRTAIQHIQLNKKENPSMNRTEQTTSSGNWEDRERELVSKFTNIIHHLQMEIAKQNMIFASQAQGDDQILDQLVNGFLAIPSLKEKLISKLMPEIKHRIQYQNTSPSSSNRLRTGLSPM